MRNARTRDRLLAMLDRFPGTRIAVVADLIADEFLFGQITRVSREAPVLILKHTESKIVPGGGANAVYNLRSLGADPVTFGCVGRDDAGSALLNAFRQAGIRTEFVLRRPHHKTTTKTRILASLPHSSKQQVLRIDREHKIEATHGEIEKFLSEVLASSSGLLISDYANGSVPPSLSQLPIVRKFAARKPVTVDSRHDILSFSGMTAATPNEGEVETALGARIGDDPDALERAGRGMLRRLGCAAVLVTRGSKGMALFERGRRTVRIPIYGGEEQADVTGAGDTVIATFTLALCCGASFADAAILSNFAGGIVVTKRGTATVTRAELADAVRTDLDGPPPPTGIEPA
ncbi:MAG: PfkB family carbohydrate kinase [Acidobacteriota bacterium]